jgi:hypothetical protein
VIDSTPGCADVGVVAYDALVTGTRYWSVEEEKALYDGYVGGRSAEELAQFFERSTRAIEARLNKLGLRGRDGQRVQPIPPFVARTTARQRDAQGSLVVPSNLGKRWSEEEDKALYNGHVGGCPVEEMAATHERGHRAVKVRLRKLGLLDSDYRLVDPPPPFQPLTQTRKPPVKAPVVVACGLSEVPIEALRLKTHLSDRLKENGYLSVAQVAAASASDLQSIQHIRWKKCCLIEDALVANGLKLGMVEAELVAVPDDVVLILRTKVRGSLEPLPIEAGGAWPAHGCLPLPTWFVAQIGPALLDAVDRADARTFLLHLGWGSGRPPMDARRLARRLETTRSQVQQRIEAVVQTIRRLAADSSSPLSDVRRVAAELLLHAGVLDKDRLILLGDTLYCIRSNAAIALLAILAGDDRPLWRLIRVVRRTRASMATRRARAPREQRRARRWMLLWLGAYLPKRLAVASTLDDLCARTPRTPFETSIGEVGIYESVKCPAGAGYESGLERKVLQILDGADEVQLFRSQSTVIDRLDTGRPYFPDMAALTQAGVTVVIEVKPDRGFADGEVLNKTISALHFAAARGAVFILTDHVGKTTRDLLDVRSRPELEIAIRAALEGRDRLSFKELLSHIRHLPKRHRQLRDIAAAVLRNELSISFSPYFELARLSPGATWKALLDMPSWAEHGRGGRANHADSKPMRRHR